MCFSAAIFRILRWDSWGLAINRNYRHLVKAFNHPKGMVLFADDASTLGIFPALDSKPVGHKAFWSLCQLWG